jgi:hypothetical protein
MHTPVHARFIRRTGVIDPNSRHTSGKVANGDTVYFEFHVEDDLVTSIQFRWLDATTAGTFTVESSNLEYAEAGPDIVAGSSWFPEAALTITSPTGVAAGTFMLHISNYGVKRLRVKYVATADSEIEVLAWGIH